MNSVVIASDEADSAAARAVEQHHAQLAATLTTAVERLLAAAARADSAGALAARDDLAWWCHTDLLPHAAAEERALYPAARATERGSLLVETMLAQHRVLSGLVAELERSTDVVRAGAVAKALAVLFEAHLTAENEVLVPLLAATSGISLAQLLDGMHEALGERDGAGEQVTEPGPGGHHCSCGEADAPGMPELDSRTVPHAIRHATIFGALDAAPSGGGLVLVASHDPLPLLAQVDQRNPDAFEVDYLERGPEVWRLRFLRR